jgi:hypothetical protein
MLKASAAAALFGISALVSPAMGADDTFDRVPEDLRGVWGADCGKPEMRFDERALYQFVDRSTSPVNKVVRRSGEIELHYQRVQEKIQVVDTFVVEGAMLRLSKSQYGAQAMRWNKKPWQRCEATRAGTEPAQPLGLASVRFPGEKPTPTTQPHLAKVVKAVADSTKAACEIPQYYHWKVAGRPMSDVTALLQGVVNDLRGRNFTLTKQDAPANNVVVVRVDNPEPVAGNTPLTLAFYLEDKTDFFLIACTTK